MIQVGKATRSEIQAEERLKRALAIREGVEHDERKRMCSSIIEG